MFSDAYTTIEHGNAAHVLDKLNPLLDGSSFDPTKSRLISHSLPFYKGMSVYEVSDFQNDPPRTISFVAKEGGADLGEIYILNGTNEPIYALNKVVSIDITPENIRTYVRFFFHYVRGRFGRFNIIENVDDIKWREEPSPAGRKALSKMIQPLDIKHMDDQGNYHLMSSIIFKDSLFESDVAVQKDGTVTLSNQEMLVEDIPVLDDSFQQ